MAFDSERVPAGLDVSRPNVARVYDYTLGGKDNFAVDRQVADLSHEVMPARAGARANRAFLRRAVRHLVAEAGIRQFIDIGSGLPTQGNVHEVAQSIDPTARIVYVDYDPVVLVHARALLGATDTTEVITADVRRPREILEDPTIRRFLDFDQPIGLLLFAILHHVNDDEDPAGIARTLRDALPAGSYLALSHFHNPGAAQPAYARMAAEAEKVFAENLGTGRFRTRDEILAFFGDFELLEPGLVSYDEWRPDLNVPPLPEAMRHLALCGVARKRP
ncbi:MAG TPA: SAM-dependent methyltransferase [Streptosporangiaceae bacterium]